MDLIVDAALTGCAVGVGTRRVAGCGAGLLDTALDLAPNPRWSSALASSRVPPGGRRSVRPSAV
jgi:hypothetical protein